MGNTTTKDIKPEQNAMRELGINFREKIPINDDQFFYVECDQPSTEMVYNFYLYHRGENCVFTIFYSFQTIHQLQNKFDVTIEGQIVKFVFETDTFKSEQNIIIEYSFYFSKPFEKQLESMPFLLPHDRKITYLDRKYWYYMILVDVINYDFYIVESYDSTM